MLTTQLPKLNMPHTIYLLRHGETVWNLEGRIQGQHDSELTPLGQDQALRQGHTLKRIREKIGAHTIYCSPLPRAQKTAKLALGSSDFVTDPRLAEINCGQWENTTHDMRMRSDPDLAHMLNADLDFYINAPGGEGLEALTERLGSFLRDLDAPAILFSHKIALVVLRALLAGNDEGLSSNMAPPQGSILEIKDRVARFHV